MRGASGPAHSSALIALAVSTLLSVTAASPALHAQGPRPVTRQQELVAEGLRLQSAGQAEAAKARLEEARTVARGAGDVAAEAAATRGLGSLLLAAKDYAGARARLDEALVLYESIHDLRGMGQTHSSMGLLAWTTANWADVRQFYTAAADEFGAAGEPAERAQQLRNATFDPNMSDAERADHLRQAWEVTRPLGDPRREGVILHAWGDVLTMQGDYTAAFEKLEAAALLLGRGGSPLEVSYVATSLGRAYRLNGLPEKALPYYQQALAIAEQSGDPRAIAQALGAVAVAYDDLGLHVEALGFATRSLEQARASGNRPMVMSAINQLAEKQLAVGRRADAIALLEPVLKNPDEAMTRMEVFLRVSLARAYAAEGRFDDAAREAERAVLLGEVDDRPTTLLWALDHRARIRLARQDGPGASADTQRALALVERLRATLPPRDFLKQGFGDMEQQVFALAIDVRVTLRDTPGALVTAEQARARAFQDLLATREQSGRARASGTSTEALPSGASAEPPDLVALKAIVARLGSPLLAYWVAPHKTFVWVVTPDGAVEARTVEVESERLAALALAVSSGPTGSVTRGAAAMASGATPATAPRAAHSGELRELYNLLIRPVRSFLEPAHATRLTVIPHGPLFRVSFAALEDERGQYLVERYELHYAPAVGVLRFTERNRHTGGVRRALLVADPLLPQAAPGETLPPLAGARLEVADAARRLGPESAVLTGRQATESGVRGLIAGRDLLHFATHGIVSDRDPLGSYLAFAPSGADPASDGRLTAAEIYALDISADLVVLSACRSGAGKITGDGIIGLTRGFFYAGAPSVLATLWDLADEPAQFTMRRFYAHWRAGGTKAAALRAAQRDLIRALRAGAITAQTPFGPATLTESPALWAAFVLLGEP